MFLTVVPFFELGGVSGYIPEGFLTACSFDYLDTSPSNYWFIFIYATVRNDFHACEIYPALNSIALFYLLARVGSIFCAFDSHCLLLCPHPVCCRISKKDPVEQRKEQDRSKTGCRGDGYRWSRKYDKEIMFAA